MIAEEKYKVENPEVIDQFIIDSLSDYVNEGTKPGGFLTSCLENEFVDAVCQADMYMLRNIDKIARTIYNCIPSSCWGSRESVREWLKYKYAINYEYFVGAKCLSDDYHGVCTIADIMRYSMLNNIEISIEDGCSRDWVNYKTLKVITDEEAKKYEGEEVFRNG